MSEKNKKKFVDRLQFLGIIGPFVILLTLFAVLARGSMKGWYLFFTTLVGLPLSWKWGTKGFIISTGTLLLLYGLMFPFFPAGEALWQIGASLSLFLGLFTTFLGFEEIKMMMLDQQIESQSRLDNLIELDDKFKRLKKDWDISEENYNLQIMDKDHLIEKLSDKTDTLEKAVSVMELELKGMQSENEKSFEELERLSLEKSKLEVQILKMSGELREIQTQLSLSLSDREQEYIAANEVLEQKKSELEEKIFELEEKLAEQEEYELNLSRDTNTYELNIKKLEENLREKVGEIYELKNHLALKEADIKKQMGEIKLFAETVTQKEQEILSYKAQIVERDKKIHQASTQLRDVEQDLHLARSKIETQKEQLKLAESELSKHRTLLETSLLEKDKKMGLKDKEIENLYAELEEKGNHVNELIERNKEADDTIRLYEEQVLEYREQLEEEKKLQFKEITKLNEARFALFQANLDKERLRKEASEKPPQAVDESKKTVSPRKHWLLQLEDLLKKDRLKKIVTLNQSKALYKQLRQQFDEKSKSLEEAREKLFKAETQYEKLLKKHEQEISEESKIENELEKSLFVKEEEISVVESEIKDLNGIIQSLLEELNQYEVLES